MIKEILFTFVGVMGFMLFIFYGVYVMLLSFKMIDTYNKFNPAYGEHRIKTTLVFVANLVCLLLIFATFLVMRPSSKNDCRCNTKTLPSVKMVGKTPIIIKE